MLKSFKDDPLLHYAWDWWAQHAHLCRHDKRASAAVAAFVLTRGDCPAEIREYIDSGLDCLWSLPLDVCYRFDE
jgi:hypothetical protein